mmetsp:Transcript_86873/g.245991  ORF Transcript_86873/g.245991 Transcript_86873/m.245991 type:complete len:210 (+) Transcript_86873:871-1500(+)
MIDPVQRDLSANLGLAHARLQQHAVEDRGARCQHHTVGLQHLPDVLTQAAADLHVRALAPGQQPGQVLHQRRAPPLGGACCGRSVAVGTWSSRERPLALLACAESAHLESNDQDVIHKEGRLLQCVNLAEAHPSSVVATVEELDQVGLVQGHVRSPLGNHGDLKSREDRGRVRRIVFLPSTEQPEHAFWGLLLAAEICLQPEARPRHLQ